MLNIKNFYKSNFKYLDKIFHSFNLTEKVLFGIFGVILIWSSLAMLNKVSAHFVTTIPAYGGSLTEGLIGAPRFINPLLELSDSDRDLTYLIYSGLMRVTAEGNLVPDLAESYTISDDGLTYTFILKDNIVFQDGAKVTADDVVYTVEMAQNQILRSPKRTNWLGVTVNKTNEREITFYLKQPYAPFLENTTLGILPKHIWSTATPDEFPFSPYNNTSPIGSGPYQVKEIIRNKSGIPTSYTLTAFNNYALGKPFISKLTLNFYANENDLLTAYTKGEIESTSMFSSQNLDKLESLSGVVGKIPLPRVFGVFFNQNQAPIFLHKEIRTALNMTVDKDRIVNEVLKGFGVKIDGPLPSDVVADDMVYDKEQAFKEAGELLIKNGWKLNEDDNVWTKTNSKKEIEKLSFSVSTVNTPDLKNVAEILKNDWVEFGAKVEVQTFEVSELSQNVIGPRRYEALLFGQVVGRSLDLFAFWHSSQRNTGSNVAMYTNSKADDLLEVARQITDIDIRLEKYELFKKEIRADAPAIFIYSPEFIYILPTKIKGFESGLINNRAERFQNIPFWYIETDNVWNFLTR